MYSFVIHDSFYFPQQIFFRHNPADICYIHFFPTTFSPPFHLLSLPLLVCQKIHLLASFFDKLWMAFSKVGNLYAARVFLTTRGAR